LNSVEESEEAKKYLYICLRLSKVYRHGRFIENLF